jgi:hypothetical protein
MSETEIAVAQSTTLVRATYFTRDEIRPSDGPPEMEPDRLPEPTLKDVERAIRQMRLLLDYQHLLPGTVRYSKYGGTEITIDGEELLVLRESDVLGRRPVVGSLGDPARELALDLGAPYRLRSVSTGSLNIVVEVSNWWLAAGPMGLLTLAYGICTFKPRVSARREKDLLEAYKARSERERLELEAAAQPLTKLLRQAGPERHPSERGPDRFDVADDESEVVVEWDPREAA